VPRLPALAAASIGCAIAFLAAACSKGETTYDAGPAVEDAKAGPPAPSVSPATRFGAKKSRELHWATPPGWEEIEPGEMAKARWRVAGNPDAECTLTSLPSSPLAQNVNRWRGQMSLEPIDAAAVDALPKKTFFGRPATFVELTGAFQGGMGARPVEGARLLGLICELPMASVFLKLVGPAPVVDAEQASFLALAESIGMGEAPRTGFASTTSAAGGDEHREPGAGAHAPAAPIAWTLPAGWTAKPADPPRLGNFVAEGAPNAEIYVSAFPGDVGGAKANVDRWRKQMSLPATSDSEFAALPRKKVLGADAVYVAVDGAYVGMGGGEPKAGWTFLGFVVPHGASTIFVRMTGPTDEVRKEQDEFVAFAESLRE
jgi:hypothetical protein